MADEIDRLIAETGRDPEGHALVELGEGLRRSGRLEAAVRVALAGLARHPSMPDALDLYARVLVDIGDAERAQAIWGQVLARDPRHVGALKGMGFLRYWAGDLDGALDQLEAALSVNPGDQSVVQALLTVRAAVQATAGQAPTEAPSEAAAAPVPTPAWVAPPPGGTVFADLDGADRGILLVSDRGLVLGGHLRRPGRGDVSEKAAAFLAGAAQEGERTSRMLGMGPWKWILVEGSQGNLYVSAPTETSLLLVVRDRDVPTGRLEVVAERASEAARAWLEDQRL